MKTVAKLIFNNRVIIVIIVVVLTIFSGRQMIKIKMNADFATYLRQDDPLVQQYDKLGDKFGGKSTAMVLIETEDIFSAKNIELIMELTEAYQLMEEISYVTSLANVLDFKKVDYGLEVGKLITTGAALEDKETLSELKDYVMSKEMYEGNLISYDGTTAMIAIRLAPDVNEYSTAQKIKETTIRIAPSIENIYFGGMPFLIYSITEGILDSLNILLPLMIFLLFSVLYLGFRTITGIFLPLSIVIISNPKRHAFRPPLYSLLDRHLQLSFRNPL